jgi:hypothetical protein
MTLLVDPRAWLQRRRARTEADHWIGHGFQSRYPWRVAELTAPRERKLSARSIHRVLTEINGSRLPGAMPLCVTSLRPHVELLERIEARLLDDEPVSAVGMLAVDELLTSPGSCLYAQTDDAESPLRAVLAKLEVH